jgi:hypothetical protein
VDQALEELAAIDKETIRIARVHRDIRRYGQRPAENSVLPVLNCHHPASSARP